MVPLPEVVRQRPPHRGGGLLLHIVLIVLIAVLLAAGGGLYYLDRSYQGKIYPNVMVQGMPIGDMTPTAAEAALHARYEDFLRQPATLTFGNRIWHPTPEELGIAFD